MAQKPFHGYSRKGTGRVAFYRYQDQARRNSKKTNKKSVKDIPFRDLAQMVERNKKAS